MGACSLLRIGLLRAACQSRIARHGSRACCPLPGMALNQYFAGNGEIAFKHACKLGCGGIVSKRIGSAYHSGRSKQWVKVKNPAAPAVRREAEEEWHR